MSRFYRVVSNIAVVFIGLGVLLGGVGVLLGGRIGDLPMGARFGFPPRVWGSDTVEADYTDIHTLDFQFEAMDVIIQEGDGFHIKAERVNSRRFDTYQDGHKWMIRCDNRSSGLNRINWGNSWDKKAPKVVVTLPKGFTADRLELQMGMGFLTADGLAADRSDIELGMGEMTLRDFSSGGCDIGVGMGSLTIVGDITGRGAVNCGMGSVEIFLEGRESDYGFDASVGMGSVNIGLHSIDGLGGEMTLNTGAPNFSTVDCGMGSVDIVFGEE